MSKPRKQHYVPQFYLRNFSLDENKIGISSYNYKTGKFFIDVPIKSQAYREYMYGEDGLIEKDLSQFESKIATLISDPHKKINPPDNLEDFTLLREFVLVQHSRTAKAGMEALAALNNAYDAMRPYLKDPHQIPENLKISHAYPSVLSLYRALDHRHLMGHLMMKSIVNMSTISFITSDNPIATYNIWMERQGYYAGATALAVKGLLIFIPIAPRLMYCFYDPYIYEFGDPDKGFVETQSETEIHQLNGLQYLHSESQLFFSEKTLPLEYVEDLAKNGNHLRVPERSFSQVVKTINESGKEELSLFNSFEDPHFGLDLLFIQLTQTGHNSKLSKSVTQLHPNSRYALDLQSN